MDPHLFARVRAQLGSRRLSFPFFRGRHALLLLADQLDAGWTLPQLKRSPFNRLLSHPVIRAYVASRQGRPLDAGALRRHGLEDACDYELGFGRWPDEGLGDPEGDQVSRAGVNLVVRLDLGARERAALRRIFGPDQPVQETDHPHAGGYGITLAWARVDLDPLRGEALIEEVQSDWVREARKESNAGWLPWRVRERWGRYVASPLRRPASHWSEATLAAAIHVLRHELGVHRIYYHSWRSSLRLKHLDEDWGPPRSLYTDLPRRFCFQPTSERPALLVARSTPDWRAWIDAQDPAFLAFPSGRSATSRSAAVR